LRHSATSTGTEFRPDARPHRGLPAREISRLSRISPLRAFWGLVETVGLLAACIAACLIWWTPWVVIPALFIIAARQQACFVLAHDAAHYRMFKARWLNDLIGRVVAAPVGISMCTYRVIHRLHHNHLYEARDPDTPIAAGYPRGRMYLFKKLVRDFTGLTAPKTYAYFFGAPAINDDAEASNRPLDDTSPALRQAARQDRWTVAAFHVAAPVVAYSTGYLVEYLVLWILPLVSILQAILRFRAILEHGAVSDISSPLTAARTNIVPWWLSWYLFPHRVNYHVEHHLYPSVPFYNLPACHAAMKEHGLLEGAEVRSVFETMAMVVAEPA
jgi:fatty acid desaturase